MRIIALLALCVAAVSAVPANPQRIVGGFHTTIDEYPSMASLLYSWNLSTYTQTCGGTVLNNRSILTAAHCTFGDAANRWRVRVGSTMANSGGVIYNSASIINHPSYDSWTNNSDIAIIRTASAITHNNQVRPAHIAGANFILYDNSIVWAVGYGAFYSGGPASEHLRHVGVLTVNIMTCAQRYATRGISITENMLCNGPFDGYEGQCQGDSGGPLYRNGVQVGIYSFGIGCGDAFFPGVNTRVSRYAFWIQSNA